MTIKETINELLKKGMSYKDIAKEIGVSDTTVARWYSEKYKPSKPIYEKKFNDLYLQITENLKDFKIGDRIQFKSWKEMKKEFGLNSLGEIKCKCVFAKEMSFLCNTYATISDIKPDRKIELINFSAKGNTGSWYYSLDMIKHTKTVSCSEITDRMDDKQVLSIDDQIKFLEDELAKLKAQKEKEKWKFTEDEKVILRNIPKNFNWLIRSQGGDLFVFTSKPQKIDCYWESINKGKDSYCEIISIFNHLFKCIQWSDNEPCEFRKFI